VWSWTQPLEVISEVWSQQSKFENSARGSVVPLTCSLIHQCNNITSPHLDDSSQDARIGCLGRFSPFTRECSGFDLLSHWQVASAPFIAPIMLNVWIHELWSEVDRPRDNTTSQSSSRRDLLVATLISKRPPKSLSEKKPMRRCPTPPAGVHSSLQIRLHISHEFRGTSPAQPQPREPETSGKLHSVIFFGCQHSSFV
jgi:hypothetical protein